MKKNLLTMLGALLIGVGGWSIYSLGLVPFTPPKLERSIAGAICSKRGVDTVALSGLDGCSQVLPKILSVRTGKDRRHCANAKIEVEDGSMFPVRIIVITDLSHNYTDVEIVETDANSLLPEEADSELRELRKRAADPIEVCKNPHLPTNVKEAEFYRDDAPLYKRQKELKWAYYCDGLSKDEVRIQAKELPNRAKRPNFSYGMPKSPQERVQCTDSNPTRATSNPDRERPQ
jgi:hypothetical protein